MMIDVPSSSDTTRHSSSELDSALAASSVDFDAIWRFQDEVRTVVNSSCKRGQRKMYFFLPSGRRIERSSTACLGDCIWNLSYNPARQCIELELERHLDDEEQELLSSQLTLPADYDGEGDNGSMFVIYPW